MKQSLHRSITFWSGLLVIAFTCWAWWDSFHHEARGVFNAATLVSENGGVVAAYFPGRRTALSGYEAGAPYLRPDFAVFQQPSFARGAMVGGTSLWTEAANDPKSARNAAELYTRLASFRPPGSWLLFIPYWLVLICIVSMWSALLFWRARRRKRAGTITP